MISNICPLRSSCVWITTGYSTPRHNKIRIRIISNNGNNSYVQQQRKNQNETKQRLPCCHNKKQIRLENSKLSQQHSTRNQIINRKLRDRNCTKNCTDSTTKEIAMFNKQPVSYTHLDVYKRQQYEFTIIQSQQFSNSRLYDVFVIGECQPVI